MFLHVSAHGFGSGNPLGFVSVSSDVELKRDLRTSLSANAASIDEFIDAEFARTRSAYDASSS